MRERRTNRESDSYGRRLTRSSERVGFRQVAKSVDCWSGEVHFGCEGSPILESGDNLKRRLILAGAVVFGSLSMGVGHADAQTFPAFWKCSVWTGKCARTNTGQSGINRCVST